MLQVDVGYGFQTVAIIRGAKGASLEDVLKNEISGGNPNTPPIAVDDSGVGFETDEDSAVTTASVLINDTDDDGDALSVIAVDASATQGLVTDNGDGTFNYDPNGAFEELADGESATDMFAYTIADGKGGESTATVTITINGVDDRTRRLSRSMIRALGLRPTKTVR